MKYTPKRTPFGAGWYWTNLDAIGNKKPWKPDGARVLGINWMSLEYCLERAMGIEPTALAWEARVLPLYDARAAPHFTRVLWGLANRGREVGTKVDALVMLWLASPRGGDLRRDISMAGQDGYL